ncbi:MAG: multifunctional CCA addition/repair protein [Pseudohongiellaceae bacterium]|jgi:tRNA nucleotidyltransferase (CCA-adding enzyme)|nr:multifunctional CCA addition/repair protein [Gammaproteobacteria bacterium]
MQTYLVGGAVRDKLLGLETKDRDWVVVGAAPQEMLDLGYQQVGQDFPVFLDPESHDEYALARTERKTGPGYKGFAINSSPEVTLEEDLLRRDLTINAIAMDENGSLIDPFGGQFDIEDRVLRHVSGAFVEDPLRVLRVARFAARFAHLGFRVANETRDLMRSICHSGELDHLVPERIWKELELALTSQTPSVFIEVLRECYALAAILPEVNNLFGVPQPEKYHPEIDTGLHILLCLEQARKLSDDSVVLYATLVHDVGKGLTDPDQWPSHVGHEAAGLSLLNQIESRLRVPKEHAQLSRLVCEHHTKLHRVKELKPATVLKLLESLDAFRRPERLDKFLLACEADARGRTGLETRDYPQNVYLKTLLLSASAIDSRAVLAASRAEPKAAIYEARLSSITKTIESLKHDQ